MRTGRDSGNGRRKSQISANSENPTATVQISRRMSISLWDSTYPNLSFITWRKNKANGKLLLQLRSKFSSTLYQNALRSFEKYSLLQQHISCWCLADLTQLHNNLLSSNLLQQKSSKLNFYNGFISTNFPNNRTTFPRHFCDYYTSPSWQHHPVHFWRQLCPICQSSLASRQFFSTAETKHWNKYALSVSPALSPVRNNNQ